MEEPTLHALHCQPSTSGQDIPQYNHTSHLRRDTDSPISPSGSNTSKNTTTNSSISPQPVQVFPTRSPSLQTSTTSSVKKLFGKTPAPLSSRAQVVQTVNAPIPPHQRLIQVNSLTKETLSIAVEQKCQVFDVYHCCCSHLGIDDARFLGLAIRSPSEGIGSDKPRHEYYFLQNDQKVAKYLPKQSRFSKTSSSEKCRPVLVLYLRVKVFVERIDMITCQIALHHYYLQLRENLLDQWSGSNSIREERCWELASLALQADEAVHLTPNQFRAEKYFPLWVINLRGLDYVRKNMPKVCRPVNGANLSSRDAKMQFCQEASRSPFALNCHLYGLRRHKADLMDNALIGITDKGIDMWDVAQDGERIPLRALAWNRMTRLTFDHKKLTIGGTDNSKMSVYAQSDEKARYLLTFCKDVHQQLIQINLHFALALNKAPYTSFPPGWGNEVCVDSGRLNARLPSLNLVNSNNSPVPPVSSQPSPASSSNLNGVVNRVPSPHPLMRIHQQRSIDSETLDSETSSMKERTSSEASSIPTPNVSASGQEPPKKKRLSGCAKAKISSSSSSTIPPNVSTASSSKPGRYEQNPSSHRGNRVSPTYSQELRQSPGIDSGVVATTPAEQLESFLNSAASPPRFKYSDEDLQYSSAMTNSTSSGMSVGVGPVPVQGTVQSAIQHFEGGMNGVNPAVTQHDPLAERRSHFVVSKTFDDYSIPQQQVNGVLMEPASRSMHDLRFQQQPGVYPMPPVSMQPPHGQSQNQSQQAFRPPPNYQLAIQRQQQQQIQQHHHQQQQQQQNLYGQQMHPQIQKPRYQTVGGGTDSELISLLQKMNLQQQQFFNGPPPPLHQPRPQMTREQIEAQQQLYSGSRGLSEPRLNMNVNPSQNLYANIPAEVKMQQQQQMRTPVVQVRENGKVSNGNGKKQRRYTSRSPSGNRSINRVKSMPNHTASQVNEINGRYPIEDIQNQNPNSRQQLHFQKQPPPYQAIQMQREADRKNALEKRHSTAGIDLEQLKKYPMLNMLSHENGIFSTSSDTTTSTASHLPEYDNSSIDSHAPQDEYLQRKQSGSFTDRYGVATPTRYHQIQQQAVSHSPPSPPFHFGSNNGAVLWNGNNGFVRGEYLFQDQPQFMQPQNGVYGYGYPNGNIIHSNASDGRSNGTYSQQVVDLPNPPPYSNGSLVCQ